MSVLVWMERIKFALPCIPVSHGGGVRTLCTVAECSVLFLSVLIPARIAQMVYGLEYSYKMDETGFHSGRGKNFLSSPKCPDQPKGASNPIKTTP
jgi:hypothetical protein